MCWTEESVNGTKGNQTKRMFNDETIVPAFNQCSRRKLRMSRNWRTCWHFRFRPKQTEPCTQQELLYFSFAVGHIFRYYYPKHTLVTTDMQGMFAIFLLLCYVTCTTSDVFSSIYQLETLVAMETDLVSCLRDLSTVNETLGHTDDIQRYELQLTI